MKRIFVFAAFFVLLFVTVFAISLSRAEPSLAAGEIILAVHPEHDWAYTETDPDTVVTFTVTGTEGVKATTSGTTDDGGFLGTWDLDWDPDHPDIVPGDGVKVSTNGSMAEVNPVGTIKSTKDAEKDTVSGTINAPGQDTVTVTCWIDQEGDDEDPMRVVENVSGDNGAFTCDFSIDDGSGVVDILPQDDWHVRYSEEDGDRVYRTFSHDWVRANYAHDWVGANYEESHTFNITLKDSGGSIKDTATAVSEAGDGWGSSGFDTQSEDWASGNNPDIAPGDSVLFESDDGYSNTLQIGTINGNLDVGQDEVTGTLDVPWLSGDLDVECHAWDAPGGAPNKDSQATADGSTSYACAWDPNTEWDILPGQDVAVMYLEADTDRVINIFREDAPNLNVDKWTSGSNEAAPGGTAVFQINVYNGGPAIASTVSLTDTLPTDMTYVDDSSGVTPTIDGDMIIWDLGALEVDENIGFYLVTENSAEDGDTLTNQVEAFADYDEDPNDNYAETDVSISTGAPDLGINMGNRPDDPAAGETFLYQIEYWNDTATPSGETTIVVEMPDVVTLLGWESEEGYDLWEGSQTNNTLTLTAPAVPGHRWDRLNLRVGLDEGLELYDCYDGQATISTANDANNDNNEDGNDFCVGQPVPGAYVNKWFNWGRLYPGGEVEYGIHLELDGNIATETTLTDMLPEGTSLNRATIRDEGNNVPFPPDKNENGLLTWELGELQPGANYNINLRLDIDNDAQPQSTLKNCAMVEIAGEDIRPNDNKACVSEVLQAPGPNVKVEKWHDWRGDDSIEFRIRVWNLGSSTVQDAQIVDTYPEFTTFNGDWWHDLWEPVDLVSHDPADRKITWEIERLEPGWSFEIGVTVELDGDKVGVQGLSYTNEVTMPLEGDVNTADNSDSNTAYSGPDLYVRKWLKDDPGGIKPGDDVVFMIEFGNNSQGWDSGGTTVLEDLLPDGLQFVSATEPWDPTEEWQPRQTGNRLQWFLGSLNTHERHTFELTVKVEEDVQLGAILTNKIEIYSTHLEDIDPVPENNEDEATVQVGNIVYLPVIMKP